MGRKSKAKDRGYQTATEWREEGGGHKPARHIEFRSLPFNCCAISFLPFEDPVRCLCSYACVPAHAAPTMEQMALVACNPAFPDQQLRASASTDHACSALAFPDPRRVCFPTCRHARSTGRCTTS